MRLYPLAWDDFDRAVTIIAYDAKDVDSVFGIPRGGLPLAVALSHALAVPLLRESPRGTSLVVDDVIETGQTIGSIKAGRVWAWVNKSDMDVSSVIKLPASAWVVFPWEDIAKAEADAEAYYASRQ